jgi:hypothetical protein
MPHSRTSPRGRWRSQCTNRLFSRCHDAYALRGESKTEEWRQLSSTRDARARSRSKRGTASQATDPSWRVDPSPFGLQGRDQAVFAARTDPTFARTLGSAAPGGRDQYPVPRAVTVKRARRTELQWRRLSSCLAGYHPCKPPTYGTFGAACFIALGRRCAPAMVPRITGVDEPRKMPGFRPANRYKTRARSQVSISPGWRARGASVSPQR